MKNNLLFLQFIQEAKNLVQKDASAEERKEFLQKIGTTLLDESLDDKSAAILENYIDTIKDVIDPDTTTAMRTDAITTLGLIVADKLDLEKFEGMEGEKAKSAAKIINSLKGLTGVIDLIKHNENPNDITKISGDKMKAIAIDMLDDFNLDDDIEDLSKEGKEFINAGKKLFVAIQDKDSIDALEIAILVQEVLDEGYDVIAELVDAVPDLKAMLMHIIDGSQAIIEHVKNQFVGMGDIVGDFVEDTQIIHAEHVHQRLMNKIESEDGDGYKDGEWNEFVENTKALSHAVAKGFGAAGSMLKKLLGFGHDDVEKQVEVVKTDVEATITTTTTITEGADIEAPAVSEDEAISVISDTATVSMIEPPFDIPTEDPAEDLADKSSELLSDEFVKTDDVM